MLAVDDATPEDHQGILALALDAFGPADEPGVRLRLEGPQGDVARWTVVRDEGRVVSTSTLLPFALRLAGRTVPAGQIEFVISDPKYQRQGLVRRQFDVHHRRSAEAGHVVQLILGIPYVYRRFGYGYGVGYPGLFHVRTAELRPDPSVTVRPADPGDLAVLDAGRLARGRAEGGLHTDHHGALNRRMWLAQWPDPPNSGPERLFVATRDDAVVGLSELSVWPGERRVVHTPTLAPDRGVIDALLAHAVTVAGDFELIVQSTSGADWAPHVAAAGLSLGPWLGIYCRIADPVAFLEAVRPVLSARLARSDLADAEGEVVISLYNDAVRLGYAGGEITEVARVPGVEDPSEERGCGIAPDWFPALVLGRWGARALEERIDDVTLGRHADLLEVLFPYQPADIADGF